MKHRHPLTVRFGDCDPAGIAYFPRIYDWFHQAMETWFSEHLGAPYDEVIRGRKIGFPAVRSEAEFRIPCALGDRLFVELTVAEVGGRSLELAYQVVGEDGVQRAIGRTKVVVVDLDPTSDGHLRSVEPPDDLRTAIEAFRAG